MRDIFNSYNVDELRKFATKYNKNVKIAGASKMKKNELVDALMKHTQFFKDVKKKSDTKPAEKKEPVKNKKPKPAEKKEPVITNIKKVKKIRMNVKGKEPVEKKENVKVNQPVFRATPNITIDKLVEEFDSPFSANVLSQYSMNKFNVLDGFLRRRIKLNETVDIDQFLASGVYISKDIVRKLILKYGVKKTFELVKDLLNQIVDGDNLKTTVAPEALTNLQKNKTVSKFFRSTKNVKL